MSEGEKVQAVMLVTVFVLGQTRLEVDLADGLADGTADTGPDGVDPAGFGALLTSLLDPADYPALSRAAVAGAFDPGDEPDRDEDFRYGLEQILDGIAARAQD